MAFSHTLSPSYNATLVRKTDSFSYWAAYPDIPPSPMLVVEKGLYHQRVKTVYPKLREQEPVCAVRVHCPQRMTIKEMEAVMKTPCRTPLIKWMKDAMRFIEHGKGDTVDDIILANAMQEKLKKAGREEDADQIADLFSVSSPDWESIMDLLALSNSQEIANEKVINDFTNNYSWKKKPLPEIHRALIEMGIHLGGTVMSDPDGNRLFRNLLARLPKDPRQLIEYREHCTWKEVLVDLQKSWNSETLDVQAVVATVGNGKHMSGPVDPVAPAMPGVLQTYTPKPVNVCAERGMARAMGEDRPLNTKTAHGRNKPRQKTHTKIRSGVGRQIRTEHPRQHQLQKQQHQQRPAGEDTSNLEEARQIAARKERIEATAKEVTKKIASKELDPEHSIQKIEPRSRQQID